MAHSKILKRTDLKNHCKNTNTCEIDHLILTHTVSPDDFCKFKSFPNKGKMKNKENVVILVQKEKDL